MPQYNTNTLRPIVAMTAAKEFPRLRLEFRPPLNSEDLAAIANPENWKRDGKRKLNAKEAFWAKVSGECIERIFDCRPFDDQLRAYVYTSLDDTQLLRIDVVAE